MAEQQSMVTYQELEQLIRSFADGLDLVAEIPGSSAKQPKQQLHLYGRLPVSILGRKPQPTYVGGLIQQGGFTGFYLMAAYTHPQEFKAGPELSKLRSGKSCFRIKQCTPGIMAEAGDALRASIELYKSLGWI